ncbi:hypothetical protein Ancab_011964 [Ancistrocladus abbreviatus]
MSVFGSMYCVYLPNSSFADGAMIQESTRGVWSKSRSFNDEGYGLIPSRWKGTCENHANDGFTCNKKLIGARYFCDGYIQVGGVVNASKRSPCDYHGHGSHTLSTAGGNFIPGASILGFGNGTAKGGSPRARVAAYKVCWSDLKNPENPTCFDSDILNGFDMAIHDGVDVISVSLGNPLPIDYFQDGISTGAFHAIKKGVVVVCSAGNSGQTLRLSQTFHLGLLRLVQAKWTRNSHLLYHWEMARTSKYGGSTDGMSLSKPMPEFRLYPLISAVQAKATNASVTDVLLCKLGSLDPRKVEGKIVACLRGETARVDKGLACLQAGVAGMILCNDYADRNSLSADIHYLPATQVAYEDGVEIFDYIKSIDKPVAFLTEPGADRRNRPAPLMASFSSVGLNTITPEILKPNITAPGVNVIAAYSEVANPTMVESDKRKSPYMIMSGTSMSCPHVSGVVGLLKTLHPDWSPAGIRSVIMTSARTRDNSFHPMEDSSHFEATPFEYGAGHIQPNCAMDPGLVYDLTFSDHLNFLCDIGYNQTLFKQFQNGTYACPESTNLYDLNYPSIAVPKLSGSLTLTRTVKNVGRPGTYVAHVRQPSTVSIFVEPMTLKFEKIGEERSFHVTLKAKAIGEPRGYAFGSLTWLDGHHYVRSPIVVTTAT